MEEDIKILESECYYLEELGYLKENNHFIRFNQALGNLIKRYKELEEENNKFRNGDIITPKLEAKTRKTIFNDLKDYIPKSKIKKIRDKAEVMDYYVLSDVIDDLNKLLEDK